MTSMQYMVVEACEDYEQILALTVNDETPKLGILDWGYKGEPRALFETRQAARAAITRTEHYRKAFGRTSGPNELPAAKNCKIVPVRLVQQ